MDRRTARELIERLNMDGERIARRFSLRYRVIEAERANVKRRYGICYSDGTIRIRLHHVVTKQPLKYSSLVNTLCHELAHLKHFNHGLRFRAFYAQLLEFARREGLYQPSGITPRPALAPGRAAPMEPRRRPQPARPTVAPPAEPAAAAATPGDARTGPLQLSLFG